jgi:hypothetical protein
LFFLIGVVKGSATFAEIKKPEHAIKLFVRFIIAKLLITHGLELMMTLFSIVQGIMKRIMDSAGFGGGAALTIPTEIVTKIEDLGFLASIPLWLVTLIGGLVIWVLSFIILLTVYGRFFKVYMYTAIAPIPLSAFAGEPTQSMGINFLRSYASVCLEGAIIALACIIFSLFSASPPQIDPNATAVTQVWSYLGELIFTMLVLVGAVKMSDRIAKEMLFGG